MFGIIYSFSVSFAFSARKPGFVEIENNNENELDVLNYHICRTKKISMRNDVRVIYWSVFAPALIVDINNGHGRHAGPSSARASPGATGPQDTWLYKQIQIH